MTEPGKVVERSLRYYGDWIGRPRTGDCRQIEGIVAVVREDGLTTALVLDLGPDAGRCRGAHRRVPVPFAGAADRSDN